MLPPFLTVLLTNTIEFIQCFFHFERFRTVQWIEINQNDRRQKQA